MGYEIKRMQERHYGILELLLRGHKQSEVARMVKYSAYGLSLVVRSRVFQAALAKRREEQNRRVDMEEGKRRMTAGEILHEATARAAQVQVKHLKSPIAGVAQRAAMDILDRGGVPKVSKSQGQSTQVGIFLSDKGVERIQQMTMEVFGRGLKGLPASEDE